MIGGGRSELNAATHIEFYTAANHTTVTGTLAAEITGVGATSTFRTVGHLEIDGDLNHDGSKIGFFGKAPVQAQVGVAISSAGIHAALINLGLFQV